MRVANCASVTCSSRRTGPSGASLLRIMTWPMHSPAAGRSELGPVRANRKQPSARAASLASSAVPPVPATVSRGRRMDLRYLPTHATGVPLVDGQGCFHWSSPPRGSGAAAPSGALRAIDPCGTAAFLADLRSAPPAAAIPTCPGGHPGWYGMTKAAGTAGRSEVVWLAVVAVFRFVAEPR